MQHRTISHNASVEPHSMHHHQASNYAPSQMGHTMAPEEVRYIEVPVVQELVRQIPKKEIVEVERKVPVYDYQYVDKVVEMPQIHYVDKIVEVPQIQEIIKRVPVPEIIEVPREVIRHVPKIETKIVEKIVEVPGEIIEVSKPYRVENKIVLPSYVEKEVPTVVSQKLVPTIYESTTDVMEVCVNEYVPKMVPVDVYVPKPVSRQLIAEKREDKHEIVNVPAAQWNSLVLNANPHISNEADLKDILISHGDVVPTLCGPGTQIIPPEGNINVMANRKEDDKFLVRVLPEERQRVISALQHNKTTTAYTQSNTFSPAIHKTQYSTNMPNAQFSPNMSNTQYSPNMSNAQYSPNMSNARYSSPRAGRATHNNVMSPQQYDLHSPSSVQYFSGDTASTYAYQMQNANRQINNQHPVQILPTNQIYNQQVTRPVQQYLQQQETVQQQKGGLGVHQNAQTRVVRAGAQVHNHTAWAQPSVMQGNW